MIQFATSPKNENQINNQKEPLQINLRIFINSTQNKQTTPPIHQNVQPFPLMTPIVCQQPIYHFTPVQSPLQNFPIPRQAGLPIIQKQANSFLQRGQQIIPQRSNSTNHHNQKPEQFSLETQKNKNLINNTKESSYFSNNNYSSLKTNRLNKTNQQNNRKYIHAYQKIEQAQSEIYCSICKKYITTNLRQQHHQLHKNRLNNQVTYIPQTKLIYSQIKADLQYTKQQLFQILMEYQEKEKHNQMIQLQQKNMDEKKRQNCKNIEVNKLQPRSLNDKNIQFSNIPIRNFESAPRKQLVSPNLSQIIPDDQSQCFNEQNQVLILPFALSKNQKQYPNTNQTCKLNEVNATSQELKQTKVANNTNNIITNEVQFYRHVLDSSNQFHQIRKRKKLPSNKMAFQIINKK